jgi:hypothetical protein
VMILLRPNLAPGKKAIKGLGINCSNKYKAKL